MFTEQTARNLMIGSFVFFVAVIAVGTYALLRDTVHEKSALRASLMQEKNDRILKTDVHDIAQQEAVSEDEAAPVRAARTPQRSVPITSSSATVIAAFYDNEFPRQEDTYQLAVDNYRNARIGFSNCRLDTPLVHAVFTSGTEILFQGSTPDIQIITFGESIITLNGYDLALVRLPSVDQPTLYNFNCVTNDEPHYNIASITVYP